MLRKLDERSRHNLPTYVDIIFALLAGDESGGMRLADEDSYRPRLWLMRKVVISAANFDDNIYCPGRLKL